MILAPAPPSTASPHTIPPRAIRTRPGAPRNSRAAGEAHRWAYMVAAAALAGFAACSEKVPVQSGWSAASTDTDGGPGANPADADSESGGAAGDATSLCTLDAAPRSSPLQQGVMLPGESTACQALGIVACGEKSACVNGPSEPTYSCYDKTGAWVLTDIPDNIPCSHAQLDAWATALYACWQVIPSAEIPAWQLTSLIKPSLLPATACVNLTGDVFEMSVGCATIHLMSTASGHGGCGNFGGGDVTVALEPADAPVLDTATWPFLACDELLARPYPNYWSCVNVGVHREGNRLEVSVGGSGGGCTLADAQEGAAGALKKLAEVFTDCDADYSSALSSP